MFGKKFRFYEKILIHFKIECFVIFSGFRKLDPEACLSYTRIACSVTLLHEWVCDEYLINCFFYLFLSIEPCEVWVVKCQFPKRQFMFVIASLGWTFAYISVWSVHIEIEFCLRSFSFQIREKYKNWKSSKSHSRCAL